ncbi:GFA family protein [Pseudorhodoplanes sinuspersici]|uniref:Aldehyde-activating protein n=1 Tax=Pseudorhodoplanes sinuspersici TaxID=1235591 RepID=A0A1W6ZW48_9HYPH|nr:GFA family protein [Pseudorhodoplanes sinuspersici]ARQ01617.1 aldehyde-activating protein [Pseudorhodoplanes sinuspersici]RKE73333.1 hypothetical protein DFP91_1219 [Pseudorhodoplanes sinuspersici]
MGQASSTGIAGGCLCGAVRFTAAPRDKNFGVCHCSMCRRWTAGPFLALECGATVEIDNTSNLGIYRSSEWAERGFCKACGTPLFYRLIDRDFYAVSVEAFDDRGGFSMNSQIFIDEQPNYYEFANDTKMMTGAEVFAAFAPPDAGQAKE